MRTPLLLALSIGAVVSWLFVSGCASPASRAMRGDEYARQGQYALALREYQTARRKDPSLFDIDRKIRNAQVALYLEQGDHAVDGCRWRDAERAYGEVRRLEPGHPDLDRRSERMAVARGNWHFDRGQRFLAQGDPNAAIVEFEQALTHRPDHPRAAESLARAERERAERRDRAETAYRAGLAARETGDLAGAMRRFEEALQLDPRHPGAARELESTGSALFEAMVAQGDLAAAERRFSDAIEHYENAREMHPHDTSLETKLRRTRHEQRADEWVTAGDAAYDHGNWESAFLAYERAALLSCEPGRFEERFRHARDAWAEELFLAAEAAEREGRYDDALAAYRRVVEFHPTYREVREVCAGLANRLEDAEIAYAAGCVAFEDHDLVRARERFEVCLASVPGYLDVPERLASIEDDLRLCATLYERACRAEANGKSARARVLFEECLSITRPFRDIDERLTVARSDVLPAPGTVVVPGYEEGCRAQSERDFVRAVRCFERCAREHPGHRDVATRLEDSRAALARARALYDRARQAEERCDLESARVGYQECLRHCTPFSDASERLGAIQESQRLLRRASRIEKQNDPVAARAVYQQVVANHPCHPLASRRIEEIDAACTDLDRRYERLLAEEKAGRYRSALTLALEVRALCFGYRDIEERMRRLEQEADYADGCALQAEGTFGRAILCFDRCIERDPDFRDARARAAVCREGADTDRGKPGRRVGPPHVPPGHRRTPGSGGAEGLGPPPGD